MNKRSHYAQLPTHATRTRWWRDICGHSHSLEIPVTLGHSLAKSHALGTGADGVGGILDIGATDVGAQLGEQHGADTELAIWTVRSLLGGHGVSLQVMELLCRQTEGLTRCLEVLGVDAGEEGWCCCGGHFC